MDYFAGLDISMDETHVCVLYREGEVVYESKTASTAQAIADELAKAPSCRRIVFETGRMAPILFHGLSQLGLPVVCVESRQAYQALKLLATHKTDRNDARASASGPTGFLTALAFVPRSTISRAFADRDTRLRGFSASARVASSSSCSATERPGRFERRSSATTRSPFWLSTKARCANSLRRARR